MSAAVWLQSSISSIRPSEVTFCWSTRHCACGSTLPNEPPKYRLDALALEDLQRLVVRLADDVHELASARLGHGDTRADQRGGADGHEPAAEHNELLHVISP